MTCFQSRRAYALHNLCRRATVNGGNGNGNGNGNGKGSSKLPATIYSAEEVGHASYCIITSGALIHCFVNLPLLQPRIFLAAIAPIVS